MPYKIRKKGSKFCVYNIESGKSEGCHDDHLGALAHQRVLYGETEEERSKKKGK
jgi:hypothetical protein